MNQLLAFEALRLPAKIYVFTSVGFGCLEFAQGVKNLLYQDRITKPDVSENNNLIKPCLTLLAFIAKPFVGGIGMAVCWPFMLIEENGVLMFLINV
jgi:hypothetical protein